MNVTSRLDSVTVYARGALCTRVAKVAGKAEAPTKNTVRVVGLPLSMQAGSLRARITSGSGRVLDVRPGYDVTLTAETDVPAEQKALEAAQAELARLQIELQRVEREVQELTKLKPVFPASKAGEPPRAAPVEALLKAAEFVTQELAKRYEVRRALNQQLEDANNEVQLRGRRLQESSAAARTRRAQLSRVAQVTLSDDAADAELAIEYFVPGARWAPSYALRLEKGMGSGVLTMRAAVAQGSGEDWSQVKLSLSTAALDRRTALPELKSLRIGRAQPPPARSGWREPPPGLDELFQGFDSAWSKRPASPPPHVPPMQAVAVGGPPPAKRAARRDEQTAGATPPRNMPVPAMAMAPPAPPPPPRAPMPAPGAAPQFQAQSMEMARSVAAPKGGARLMARTRGGLFGGGGSASYDAPEAPEEDELSADLDEGGYLADEEPPPAPELELGRDLIDYGNLIMPSAPGGRGRLQRAPDSGVVFLAALHVEVSVLMALVSTSEASAGQISQLPLPARAVEPTGGSFDYRYDCVARVDVPTRREWTMVPVADADVGLVAQYACVPSVEPQVYRTLKLHNRSKHALLRGPVDVTLGDEFLLTADLPLIAPGAADARLGLGVEEAIKVARKTNFKETTGGLLGGSTVLPHDVEIELSNRLAFPALIEVRERVPFSLEDDVKIEEAKVEPGWEKDEGVREGEAVRGARVWKVTVPAGEKSKLFAQYVVKIPSDKMLIGGNRRS